MTGATLSDWLWDRLQDLGVRHVFTVPAGQVEGLCRALSARQMPRAVVTVSEIGAGFMAEGAARVTGGPAVFLAGGGPGMAQALPSAINARLERTPVLYLTGTPSSVASTFSQFQDTGPEGSRDGAMMALACGDSRVLKDDPDGAGWWAARDRLARGLPAHLMVPADLQARRFTDLPGGDLCLRLDQNMDADLDRIAALHAKAEVPVLALGPRAALLREKPGFLRLLDGWNGPIVATVAASALLPDRTPNYLGHFGLGGLAAADRVVAEAGLILFIGGAPGQRDGVDWAARAGALARLDVPGAADPRWIGPEVLTPDLDSALNGLADRLQTHPTSSQPRGACHRPGPDPAYPFEAFIAAAQQYLPAAVPVFVDAGTHRRSLARLWEGGHGGMVHSSAEHAPMGWAIAAAIGAALTLGRPVLCVTGDGCMRQMAQEIATAVRFGAQVIYLVANNAGFASLARLADDPMMMGHFGEDDRLDWSAFARVLGARGCRVDRTDALGPALQDACSGSGPFVIDVHLPPLAAGAA